MTNFIALQLVKEIVKSYKMSPKKIAKMVWIIVPGIPKSSKKDLLRRAASFNTSILAVLSNGSPTKIK